MNFAAFLFYLVSALALMAALGTVLARNIVYAALSLIATLALVAGLFFILHADFLALVQLLIYGGAVSVLIIFGLMLTATDRLATPPRDRWQRPLAFAGAVAFLTVAAYAVFGTDWMRGRAEQLERVPPGEIAGELFTKWAIPFEIASLVLLVALIGAIVVAKRERVGG